MKAKPSDFSKKVGDFIQKIPKGKVATYGQIAKLAGKPQGARGVVWILTSSWKSHQLPWHRVIGSKGTISFPKGSANYREQKDLLIKEGVEVLSAGEIDMDRFQWKKEPRKKKSSRPRPKIFS